MSDMLIKRSNERNLLTKQIQAQNEKILMNDNHQIDDMDMFFKTLALTAKKFPSQEKRETKVRMVALMAELEEKYSVPEKHINSFQAIGQPSTFHVPTEQQCYQSPELFQESPSTTANSYSESTCSQLILYNFDDSTP